MKSLFCLVSMSLISIGIVSGADSLMVEEGGKLFTQNCKACHQLEQRLVGPPLQGVDKRHDEDWILQFVKSSQTMIKGGDSAAITLFNTYNQVPMPDQSLTDDQIRSILAYIKDSEIPRDVAPGGIVRPAIAAGPAPVRPPKFSDYRFWILYTVTVLLIMVSIYYKAELIALSKQTGTEVEGM